MAIPSGVDVKIDGQTVSVKGPKGQLSRTFHENMKIGRDDGKPNLINRRPQKQTVAPQDQRLPPPWLR